MINAFIGWVYSKVIVDEGTYVRDQERRFKECLSGELNGLKMFSCVYKPTEEQISDDLSSVAKFVKDEITSSNPLLYEYCHELNSVLKRKSAQDTPKIFIDSIDDEIMGDFQFESRKPEVVKGIIDKLVSDYPYMVYFKDYLTKHLSHLLTDTTSKGITITNMYELWNTVVSYISNKVQAALVLGGYDATKTGNACYPGLNAYLYHDDTKISKSKIQDIMSSRNILKVVTDAVQDTDFFKRYDSYSALNENHNNTELFKLNKDVDFLKESGLVKDGQINVKWDGMKNWLFSQDMTQETILKAFVKTQIYRNIFFDPTNYTNFTKDESKYTCVVDKFYINHDGLKKELKFTNVVDTVDSTASGLNPSGEHRTIADIQYSRITNGLSYDIIYDSIDINDNKFIYQDIEFYVMINDDGNPISVYFNQFQRESNANS